MDDEPLTAVRTIADAVRRKAVQPRDIVRRSLANILRLDPQVKAWAYVAPETALIEAAEGIDVTAALAGIPVGIKDVIDVAEMPTGYGANLAKSRVAQFDAACVAMLRSAGAIPLGKTVTAEFAYRHPGPTRNPHDLTRTPGGSSSGSAAAVAARMVPAAIATQTGGSIIRPAAFCGVTGFKPSFGAVPRDGMKMTSESLDVIGWYGAKVSDVSAIAQVLLPEDVMLRASARPPRVAVIVEVPGAALAGEAQSRLQQAVQIFSQSGATCRQVSLQAELAALAGAHRTIMQYEIARNLAPVVRAEGAVLSEVLTTCIRDGLATPHGKYREMKQLQHLLRYSWNRLFGGADFIVAPSAPGEAPEGLAVTGSSACNVAWSVLGWPCLHIPFGLSTHRMPLGIQVIANWQCDVDLLNWGAWIESQRPANA